MSLPDVANLLDAVTSAPPIDPSGLNGQRLSRSEARAPHVEEAWLYSTALTLETIREAWKRAPRRGRTLVVAVTEFRKPDAGRRFVKIDLFVDSPRVPHIDEPNV